MPTDLPENFSGSAPLGADRKAIRKLALKSMRRSLWQIAQGLCLHYAVTLAAVAVIAASGFHGVPRAALSVTVLGLLARWFLPNQARTKAQQVQPKGIEPMGVVELTPDQLSDFFNNLGKVTEGEHVPGKPTPYL